MLKLFTQAPHLPAAMNQSFLQSRCDEDGFFGTWHDFLTVPENEHGGFVEMKDKKKCLGRFAERGRENEMLE